MFTASQSLPDDTVTQYLTKLIVFGTKLIGTIENITEHAMKTHICTTSSNPHETTIQILKQHIPTTTTQ
jgi:hypothetical protein